MREGAIRADIWLWQARFFRSRALSAAMIAAGHLRVNGRPSPRAAQPVGPGDVLTFVQGRGVRVVRVLATGGRRGPASEAAGLYAGLAPAPDAVSAPVPTLAPALAPTLAPTRAPKPAAPGGAGPATDDAVSPAPGVDGPAS